MGKVVGFLFAYMSSIIPLKKLLNDKNTICFYHPVPTYDQHVLLIPKKTIGNILEIPNETIFENIAKAAIDLSKKINWKNDCVLLCANGGNRQDVKQVHFHLFSAKSMFSESFIKNANVTEIENESEHHTFLREYDSKKVIEIIKKANTKTSNDHVHCVFIGIIQTLDILSNKFDLMSKDYTLKIQINPKEKLEINNIYIEL